MSLGNHTPGPWAVEGPMGEDIGLSIVQDGLKTHDWEFIAMVMKSDRDDEAVKRRISAKEQKANATLIAAAPEMLEALKDARYALYGEGPGNPKIDAAIAKAEGKAS